MTNTLSKALQLILLLPRLLFLGASKFVKRPDEAIAIIVRSLLLLPTFMIAAVKAAGKKIT